jgi:hypothetical protein
MKGHDEDKGDGEPPQVLAARMRDQLAELRGTHARKLAELRARLQSLAFEWDATPLAQAVSNLRSAGRELRFDNLRAGWLARRMGKHKPVHARFAAAHERVVHAATKLKAELAQLGGTVKDHVSGAKRVLLELDLQGEALQLEIERGVTWLQDMCLQLSAQRGKGGTDPQIATLAEAAQAFTQEFKRLESATAIARDMRVRLQGVLDRRNALVELLRGDMDKFDKHWTPVVSGVASGVEAGHTSFPGLAAAAAAHDSVMVQLETVTEACSALQHEEHLAAQQLDMLRRELETDRRD